MYRSLRLNVLKGVMTVATVEAIPILLRRYVKSPTLHGCVSRGTVYIFQGLHNVKRIALKLVGLSSRQ